MQFIIKDIFHAENCVFITLEKVGTHWMCLNKILTVSHLEERISAAQFIAYINFHICEN